MRLFSAICLFLPGFVILAGCAKAPLHTPLNDALAAGDIPRVQALIGSGASLEEPGICGEDGWDRSPLDCAIVLDRPDLVRLLLDRLPHGSRQSQIKDALMYAAYKGKTAAAKALLDLGADVNGKDAYGNSPLTSAAYWQQENVAKLLIANGADVDYAISKAESDRAKAKSSYNKEKKLAAIRLLQDLQGKVAACTVRYRSDAALLAAFTDAAAKYRSLSVKPALPEEARMYRVQAEDAVVRKQFQEAVELYGKALKIVPWWPEGHYNQALVLGENNCYEQAIGAMERYLTLVPDAPDGRSVRDQIYTWKGRLP